MKNIRKQSLSSKKLKKWRLVSMESIVSRLLRPTKS